MKIWLVVFLGGGIGSLCRYLISNWITEGNVFRSYPFLGTFLVNITGCFAIGFLAFYFTEERFGEHSLMWRFFLITGLCGGYTTFSAFSIENLELIMHDQVFTFFAYTFASLIFCFLATYTGILFAKDF